MSDLKLVTARRAEIAKQLAALQTEDGELEVTERVLRRMSAEPPVMTGPAALDLTRPRMKTLRIISGGSPAQSQTAKSVLPADGSPMDRLEFRKAYEEKRGEAMTDNAFITMLSRLVTSGVVRRDGQSVSLNVGGADVS